MGSSSEDWILLSLRLQPLVITLNHNTNAIPHILHFLLTLVQSVLICTHNSLIASSRTTAHVSLPSRVLSTAASLTLFLCVGLLTNIAFEHFLADLLKTPLATHLVSLRLIPHHHQPAASYQLLPQRTASPLLHHFGYHVIALCNITTSTVLLLCACARTRPVVC
jgi:hypothetical protein